MIKQKKRKRRTAEQIIADLEEKICRAKERQAAKKAKGNPECVAATAAVRAIDKAIRVAGNDEGGAQLREAAEAARAPLGTFLVERGVRLRSSKSRRCQGIAAEPSESGK